MHKTLTTCALFFFLLTASHAAAENLTQKKKADIEKLMHITGTMSLATQMSDTFTQQMISLVKTTRPDMPQRVNDILAEEVKATFYEQMVVQGGLLDMLIPIYHRYFTHKEIRGLLAFYQTPLGKKTISVVPKIYQESVEAGQLWGENVIGPLIQRRVNKRLKQEGIKLSK